MALRIYLTKHYGRGVMIKIQFNEEMIEIPANMTLSELLKSQQYKENSFAVAVNRKFIPRSVYSQVYINKDDVIDIIIPMQGG